MTPRPTIFVFGSSGFIGGRLMAHFHPAESRVVRVGRDTRSDIRITKFDDDLIDKIGTMIAENEAGVIVSLIAPGVTPRERRAESMNDLDNYPDLLATLLRTDRRLSLVYLASTLTELGGMRDDPYVRYMSRQDDLLEELTMTSSVTRLKLPRVFGPGEPNGRSISSWINHAKEYRHINVSEPCRTRNLLHVDDVVQLIANAVDILFRRSNYVLRQWPIRATNLQVAEAIAALLHPALGSIEIRLAHTPVDDCQICTVSDIYDVVSLEGATTKNLAQIVATSPSLQEALRSQVLQLAQI